MTASVRMQIVDAAIALINTNAPAGVPLASDTRMESYTPAELPSIVCFEIREDGQSEKEGRWSYFVHRNFTFRVELRVASDTPRTVIDPIYVWIAQQLGQQTFSGLAEDCYDTLLGWQYADTDQPYTLLEMDFRVEYSTLKNDPTRTH